MSILSITQFLLYRKKKHIKPWDELKFSDHLGKLLSYNLPNVSFELKIYFLSPGPQL